MTVLVLHTDPRNGKETIFEMESTKAENYVNNRVFNGEYRIYEIPIVPSSVPIKDALSNEVVKSKSKKNGAIKPTENDTEPTK